MRMKISGVGSLPLCDETGRLLGMVTAREVLRIVRALDSHAQNFKARDLIRDGVATVQLEDSIESALATMALQEHTRLPVLSGKVLVGVLSRDDIGRAGPAIQVEELLGIIAQT